MGRGFARRYIDVLGEKCWRIVERCGEKIDIVKCERKWLKKYENGGRRFRRRIFHSQFTQLAPRRLQDTLPTHLMLLPCLFLPWLTFNLQQQDEVTEFIVMLVKVVMVVVVVEVVCI